MNSSWLNVRWEDPFGHLRWLGNVLAKAEAAGEAVHIIGHIPPNLECLPAWGREYGRIIER